MINPFYLANLRNLKREISNIENRPESKGVDIEISHFIDSENNEMLPIVYASLNDSAKQIKSRIKTLDTLFKEHWLVPFSKNPHHKPESFILAYAQSPRIYDYQGAYDQGQELYFPENVLLVDGNVRNACAKTKISPVLDSNLRLILTKEVLDNLKGPNGFLANLQPTKQGYSPVIPSFEQYLKFYNWSKSNDSEMWRSFDNFGELVTHDGDYKIACPLGEEPSLQGADFFFGSSFDGRIRVAEKKIS